MSFLVFQLIFAAVALALVAVVVLLVRQFVARRQAREAGVGEVQPAFVAEPQPRFGLGRKAAEPEPEAVADAPPVARRRQLHSFAEAERVAAEADAVALPVLEPEMKAEPAFEAEPITQIAVEEVPLEQAATEPMAEPEEAPSTELDAGDMTDAALDYSEAVLGRLEEAFESLQGGELTLAAYRQRVEAEHAAVEARISALQHAGESADLDAALAAQESVQWCLDWAEEQANAEQS